MQDNELTNAIAVRVSAATQRVLLRQARQEPRSLAGRAAYLLEQTRTPLEATLTRSPRRKRTRRAAPAPGFESPRGSGGHAASPRSLSVVRPASPRRGMRYTASRHAPSAYRGTALDVASPTSALAPSAELAAAGAAGRCGWRQRERRYTAEMRGRYRQDPQLWIDLVEQAAVEGVTMVGEPQAPDGDESHVRCHRRILYDLRCAVAKDAGVWVDPDIEELDRALLEMRRKAVMRERCLPLTCSVCARPADTARAIRARDGYGYGSEACVETDVARWKAQAWSAGSGRRP
jgi:uncharacterized protein YeaO (DUF488 family)